MCHLPAYRPTLRTLHNDRSPTDVIVRIPASNVFRFGDSNKASPVFEDLEWTVNEGESWAVIGSGGQKTALLQVGGILFITLFCHQYSEQTSLYFILQQSLTLLSGAPRSSSNISSSCEGFISVSLSIIIRSLA
jgi:ABC-type transport system involved in cytochrome bd biosynthesis fused ATPase/permease subunit